jgi:hypothetical protein
MMRAPGDLALWCPSVPGDHAGSGDEVLAVLAASLRRELAESQAALAQAVAELVRARERIAELEARLNQTPRNSSRPPSGEGLGKPAPRSLRKKSGRKPGGQDGQFLEAMTQVSPVLISGGPGPTTAPGTATTVRSGVGAALKRR